MAGMTLGQQAATIASRRRARTRRVALVLVGAMLAGAFQAPLEGDEVAQAAARGRPNIVVILTDDQRFDSLWAMKNVRQLADRGLSFREAIVSDPLCCPARASILTGRYAGHHGVWSNSGQYGWPEFHRQGNESHTIATALSGVGYRTGLIGKYLNHYDRAEGFVPPGWDRWFAFDEANGRYYDYTMLDFDSFDGITERRRFGNRRADYSSSVIRREAVRFIRTTPAGRPLFLMASTTAPHAPSYAPPGDVGAFKRRSFLRSPSVNEKDVRDKPRHIRRIDRFSRLEVKAVRRGAQAAAESLLAVDRMVGEIVNALRDSGRLTNTMIVFTSDNGFLQAEHRWRFKVVPYEESIKVPMIVRYDPLLRGTNRAGAVSHAVVSNVDLAPTLTNVAGTAMGRPIDGIGFDRILAGSPGIRADVLLESLRYELPGGATVPSYCGLRSRTRTYVRYSTGEQEFYRLDRDPFQLENLARHGSLAMASMRRRTRRLCVPTPPLYSWQT